MIRQFTLGDLSTTEIVAAAYARQERRAASSRQGKRTEAEDAFARDCRFYRLPTYLQHFVLPAFHRTPKLQRRATWEFDGVFPEFKLLVEIQGGIWMRGKGAHSHPVDLIRNFRKHNDCTRLGYSLLQFEPDYVVSHQAVEYTMRVLSERFGWARA